MINCIQDGMVLRKSGKKCTCTAKTPKGVSYHPTLKSVYQHKGASGSLVKAGYLCPKCNTFYGLDGEKK